MFVRNPDLGGNSCRGRFYYRKGTANKYFFFANFKDCWSTAEFSVRVWETNLLEEGMSPGKSLGEPGGPSCFQFF